MAYVTNLIAVVKKLTGRLRPPEPAASPHLIVHDFHVSKKDAADAQIQPEHRLLEWPAGKAAVHAHPVPKLSEPCRPEPAAGAAFSRQRDGEVCDVCGYVNREVTFACKQCDVPLPSSVL